MLKRRAEDAENRDGADDVYESMPDYKTSGDDEHFCITGGDVIDGERDELPA
jgi:hypothetical protein